MFLFPPSPPLLFFPWFFLLLHASSMSTFAMLDPYCFSLELFMVFVTSSFLPFPTYWTINVDNWQFKRWWQSLFLILIDFLPHACINFSSYLIFLFSVGFNLTLFAWMMGATLLSTGVKRFVYISAADFGLANYLLQGYYEGKVLSWLLIYFFHLLVRNV